MKTLEEINREFQQQMSEDKTDKRKHKGARKDEYVEPVSFPCFGMILNMESVADSGSQPVAKKSTKKRKGPPVYSIGDDETTQTRKPQGKKHVLRLVFGVLLVVVVIVTAALAIGGVKIGNGLPVKAFCIEGSSMQDVYPDGSLLFVKKVAANNIIVGENLTYYKSNMYVTHKVVEIIEDYDGKGHRAFITKGVNNDYSDPLVSEEELVGVVFGHVPGIGKIPIWLSTHSYVLIILGATTAVCFIIAVITGRRNKMKRLRSKTSSQPMAFTSV